MTAVIEAQVVVSFSSHGVIELADGSYQPCQYRRKAGRPLCNDRVMVEPVADGYGLSRIIQRRNCFIRADQHGNPREVAANLDLVVVVLAPYPEPSANLLSRYLIAIHNLELTPLIVINKMDLADVPAHNAAAQRLALESDYLQQIGYRVIQTRCKPAADTGSLGPELQQRSSILVGQSGVGKSSLINALIPDRTLQTGAVSQATRKGTHTTTATSRYHLGESGIIIDSPGVWEYGLWKLSVRDIQRGFVEFRELQAQCRYHNCRHMAEPKCAVKAAVQSAAIPGFRYDAYCNTVKLFA